MISNIGPIPVQPGDVVRDHQDSVDYVVRAAALLGAGALVVYGISLYDQSLRQWTADTYEELGLRKILTNHGGDAPEAVVAKLTELLDKPGRVSKIAGRADFYESLFSEQGRFFRDLLMVGSEVQEFNSRLGEMANALIGTTRRIWTADEIFHAFSDSVHPDAFDSDFLQQFSNEFAFRIQAEANLNRVQLRPNTPGGPQLLRDLMLPQAMDAEGFANTGIRQLRKAYQRKGTKALGREGRSLVRRVLNPELGDPILGYLGVAGESTASDRLTALVAKTMQKSGARESTMVVKTFLDSLIRRDTKRLLNEKLPSTTLANLLDDSRLEQIVGEVVQLSHTQKRKRNRSPRTTMVDREIERQLIPLKKVELGQFMGRHQTFGDQQFYSVDANTFFQHYVNGHKIKVGDRVFDLTSLAENEAARHTLFGGEKTVMSSSRHMIQALRKLEKDEVADLTHLVDHSNQVRSRLSSHVLSKINQFHFADQMTTSRTRGVVGFRFKTTEFTPELLRALKDAQKESMVAYEPRVLDELARPIAGHHRLFIAKTGAGKVYADRHMEALDALVGRAAEQEETTFYYSQLTTERMKDFMSGKLDPSKVLAEPLLPFGDQGMVGRWRQQFAAVDVGIADPTHRILQTVESVEGLTAVVESGYRKGYQFGKMSFVSIKNLDGTGAIRAIGTDLGSVGDAIQQQLTRADMLLNPDATIPFLDDYGKTIHRKPRIGFLDLETDPGSKLIKEVSVASAEDLQRLLELTDPIQNDFLKMTSVKARETLLKIKETAGIGDELTFKKIAKNASMETRMKNLTSVLEKLSGFDQIWAQSTNDYRFLLDELNAISKSGKLSGEAYTIYRDMIMNLAEKHGVTAETVPQLTGHLQLGNSGQPLATAKYLGRGEFHSALFDNLDAFRLQTTVYKDEYQRIRQGMEVLDMEHNPVTVVFRNSRLSDIDNQKIQILGMTNMMDQHTGGTKTQMTYRNANGDLRVLSGSPAQLGRTLGDVAEKPIVGQSLQEFLGHHTTEQTVRQVTKNVEDRVRRLANELNPLSETILDVGQLSGLKGAAIVQPRGAKVYRARYIANKVYADFRSGVGTDKTSDFLEQAAMEFVGDNSNFRALMDRYGVKLNMSDDMLDSTREDVGKTLSSLTDVGEAAAQRRFFEQLGAGGDQLAGLALNEATMEKFDATVLHLFADANRSIEKAQSGVHFSLRLPDIHNKIRAKILLTEELDRDPTHTVNQFVGEMINYAALEPDSKAGMAAREALESAGVKDLEGVMTDVLKLATRNGWKNGGDKSARNFLFDQGHQMVFGMSQEFTDTAGEAGVQYLRGAADLPDLFARTFIDRAEQITDEGQKTRVMDLAAKIHGRIAGIQAELSEADRDIAAFMGMAVREELASFLAPDPTANLHMLTQDIEVLDVVGKLSDQATVAQAIKAVDQELDDPDAMDIINHAMDASTPEEAVKRLRREATVVADSEGVAESQKLATAMDQVVRGVTMEAGLDATVAAGKNTEVELLHRAVNAANPGFVDQGLTEAVHAATLGMGPIRNAKLIGNITKPLMAIAGAAALLAAANPPLDENYTGGLRSKQRVNINDPVNRFSEIPGAGSTLGPVFTGQEQPFKLDINIRGLAANEEQKQMLIDRVYDTLTQQTEYMVKRNTIREKRMESFRQPAADILKANI